jgi:hypothetical protein
MINNSSWLRTCAEHVWRHQDGAKPMRGTAKNSDALTAYITRKAAFDTILARLTALSAEHFNTSPDDVTWADVGTLGSYLDSLRRISDAAFNEGDHAG